MEIVNNFMLVVGYLTTASTAILTGVVLLTIRAEHRKRASHRQAIVDSIRKAYSDCSPGTSGADA